MPTSNLTLAQETISTQFFSDILHNALDILHQIQSLPAKASTPVIKAHVEQRSEQAADVETALNQTASQGEFLLFNGQILRVLAFADYIHDIDVTLKASIPDATDALRALKAKYQAHIYPLSGRNGYLSDEVTQYLNMTLRQAAKS